MDLHFIVFFLHVIFLVPMFFVRWIFLSLYPFLFFSFSICGIIFCFVYKIHLCPSYIHTTSQDFSFIRFLCAYVLSYCLVELLLRNCVFCDVELLCGTILFVIIGFKQTKLKHIILLYIFYFSPFQFFFFTSFIARFKKLYLCV
jgi:hypothetical protein